MSTQYEVQGNYGQGWEQLITEDDRSEARERLKEYNDNEPQYPHRIKASQPATIRGSYADLQITARPGDKPASWHPSGQHYRVTIRRNNKRTSFDYWDSLAAMERNEDADPLDALHCWMGDALIGWQCSGADEIADEFGYTKPSEAIRVWQGASKARQQAERLGFTEQALVDMYNGLDR